MNNNSPFKESDAGSIAHPEIIYISAQKIKQRILTKLDLLIDENASATSLLDSEHYLRIQELMRMPGKNPKSKEFIIEKLSKLEVHDILDEAMSCSTPLNVNLQRIQELNKKLTAKITQTLSRIKESEK